MTANWIHEMKKTVSQCDQDAVRTTIPSRKVGLLFALCVVACVAACAILGLQQVTMHKRAFTCAECRKLQWEYKWHGMLISKREVDTSCSKWVAQHDQRPHEHSWIGGENTWLVGLLGDNRGVASSDYQSYIWRISPESQLDIYCRATNATILSHRRQMFRKFVEYQSGDSCEQDLVSAVEELDSHESN